MTNTNDFRKFTYQPDYTALIQSFSYTRGSQAPKAKPAVEEPERKLRVVDNKGIKSKSQLKREQRKAYFQTIRICLATVLILATIGVVINSFAVKNELTREISRQEVAIANAKSEYISLESELNAMVSISMIDKYAVNKLGMTKARADQVQYMDVDAYRVQRDKKTAKTKMPASVAPIAMAAAVAQPKKSDSKDSKKNAKGNAEVSEETVIND